jgi:ABC-type dipeptide/oligopeptide/nickel transport system permease subunit
MWQRYWHPSQPRARWKRFRERGGLSLSFGLLIFGALIIVPLTGRVAINRDFYEKTQKALHINDTTAFRPPPFLYENLATTAPVSGRLGGGRPGETTASEVEIFFVARFTNPPAPGAVLGTDQRGANVLWRLVHGTEVVILWGTVTALASVLLGLIWGIVMGWWNPPLFPGHHRPIAGWRRGVGWAVEKIFEFLDLFPRIILLLFLTAIAGITLVKFAFAVGVIIALQVAAGVRQHTVALRMSDTVLAAEELGLQPSRIVWVHIVWHRLRGFLLSQLAYAMGAFVLWEATIGYLGITNLENDTWGRLIKEAAFNQIPWMLWSGLACLMVATLGLIKLGDGIDRWKARR